MTGEISSSLHTLTIDTTHYDKTLGTLTADLITIPLKTGEGKTVLMQVLRHKLNVGSDDTRPHWTVATMGGGASGAMEGAGVIKRIADAVTSTTSETDKSSISITSVVNISHPQGAPREQDIIDKEDFHQSAELVVKTLLDSQVQGDKTAGFILWGFSAGGGVLIEVARLLQEKGTSYKLILIDPAATSSHKNLLQKIVLGTNRDIFHHFRLQDEIRRKKLGRETGEDSAPVTFYATAKVTAREMMDSMTTPEGAPKEGKDLVKEWFGQGQTRLNKTAREHGLPKSTGGPAPNLSLLDHDVTYDARQALTGEVILVSPLFAKAVNLLTSRGELSDNMLQAVWGYQITHQPKYHQKLFGLLQQKYPKLNPRELLRKTRQLTQDNYFDQEIFRIAQELFPRAQIQTLPVFAGLHSGILRNQHIYEWAIKSVLK